MKIVYKIAGKTVSKKQLAAYGKSRTALHGGMDEIIRSSVFNQVMTDKEHRRINRSGLLPHEKEVVARKAKAAGMPAESAYDPTIPGCNVYETRKQVDNQVAEYSSQCRRLGSKPYYRINPKHMPMLRHRAIALDPSLAKVGRQELDNEIVRRHSPSE